MDWQLAIEKNREALRRIVAMLVAMIGVPAVSEGGHAGISGGLDRRVAPKTLPRQLHRLVLRLLRPAEAAARRLVIVAARELVVELAPLRQRKPKPKSIYVRSGVGTGIVRRGSLRDRTDAPSRPASLSLPLFDPLKRFGARRRFVKPGAAPRIRSLDDIRVPLFHRPAAPKPPPLTPDDPLDAGRLSRRIEAIGRTLDDLPRQAKRLARWRARCEVAVREREDEAASSGPSQAWVSGMRGGSPAAPPGKPRTQRFSPIRPGRPPGWRGRQDHPVYEVLNDLHGLAFWAMERPDTS